MESMITGITYLSMLENWLFPHLEEDVDDYIFLQDGPPPHFHCEFRRYLNETLPRSWIGRATVTDLSLSSCPLGRQTSPRAIYFSGGT
jgi:hypothetical protein